MFSLLQFGPHNIPNAVHATYTFDNGWSVSVVSGPAGSGLYGRMDKDTYEVAIINPQDEIVDNVIGWQTPDEVSWLMQLTESK